MKSPFSNEMLPELAYSLKIILVHKVKNKDFMP